MSLIVPSSLMMVKSEKWSFIDEIADTWSRSSPISLRNPSNPSISRFSVGDIVFSLMFASALPTFCLIFLNMMESMYVWEAQVWISLVDNWCDMTVLRCSLVGSIWATTDGAIPVLIGQYYTLADQAVLISKIRSTWHDEETMGVRGPLWDQWWEVAHFVIVTLQPTPVPQRRWWLRPFWRPSQEGSSESLGIFWFWWKRKGFNNDLNRSDIRMK